MNAPPPRGPVSHGALPRHRLPTHRLDLAGVALVALVVYLLHGFNGVLSRDLGVFVYGGEQVARGVPPYVGIFNTVGPLADAVPGLAIWLGHLAAVDPVYAARAAFLLLSVACTVLVSVLARDVLGSRAAGLVAAAVFLTFGEFITLATGGPREKTTMLLFLLLALVMVQRGRWARAGFFTALATLTWQPVLLVAVAVAVAAAVLGGPGRVRALARFVVGGLVPTAVALVVFAASGALGTAVAGFVTASLGNPHQASLLSAPGTTLGFLWTHYQLSLVLVLLGSIALLLVGGRTALRARAAGRAWAPQELGTVALAVGGLTGLLWLAVAINGPPDLFEVLPFAAVGAAAGVLALVRRLARPATGAVLVGVVAAAVALAVVESVSTSGHLLVRQRTDVAAVLAAAPTGSTLLSINAPEVMALAGRANPTAYQVFDRSIDQYLSSVDPGGVATYAGYVAQTRPTLLAVSRAYASSWPASLLAQDYRYAGSCSTWSWYVSRTAGDATWAAVHDANLSVGVGV